MAVDPPLRLATVQLDGIPQALSNRGHWLPAEPLFSGATDGRNDQDIPLAVRSLFDPASPQAPVAQELEALVHSAVAARLHDVFRFLDGLAADVVVLPEYAVPVSCLPILVEYSTDRVIVAGVGYVRNPRIAQHLATWDDSFTPDDLDRRNVAVLVTDGRVHLTTKKHAADREQMRPGRGPRVVPVRLRNAEVRLGVAICKDFLNEPAALGSEKVDLVCVPARTAKAEPFVEHTPRDCPKLFANDAHAGRSTILVPEIASPFADDDKVTPVAPGFEAVVVVEYHGYQQRPSSLWQQPNRLVSRSEIIEDDDEDRRELPGRLTRLLADPDRLDEAAVLGVTAGSIGAPAGPLAETLAHCRQSILTDQDVRDALQLAAGSMVVSAGHRSGAVRRRQAERILRTLAEITPRPAVAGQAEDRYRSLLGGHPAAGHARRPAAAPPTEPEAPPKPPRPEPVAPAEPPRWEPEAPAEPAPAPARPVAARPQGSGAGVAAPRRAGPEPAGTLLRIRETTADPVSAAVAFAVDEDMAVIPARALPAAQPVQLAPIGGTGLVPADVAWVRPAGDVVVLAARPSRTGWKAPGWGRLATEGGESPCLVLTAGVDGDEPAPAGGHITTGPAPATAYRLTIGAAVDPGSPVFCAGRCVGFVADRPDLVWPAETVVWSAWRAGLLRSRPVFDAIEFLDHEMRSVPHAEEAPVPDDRGWEAWSAGPALQCHRDPVDSTDVTLQRFLHRRRLAGWMVLTMTAAELRGRLPGVLRARFNVLVLVSDGERHRDELAQLFAACSRRPDEPAVRFLLAS